MKTQSCLEELIDDAFELGREYQRLRDAQDERDEQLRKLKHKLIDAVLKEAG